MKGAKHTWMRNRIILLCLSFITAVYGKVDSDSTNQSVFGTTKQGNFLGIFNGFLVVEDLSKQLILDVKDIPVMLKIQADSDEVYDVSYKKYIPLIKNKTNTIQYSYYAGANEIELNYNGQLYSISTIDGACDTKIKGTEITFFTDAKHEYLIISLFSDIKLDNIAHLINKGMVSDGLEASDKIKSLILKKGSILHYTIKR